MTDTTPDYAELLERLEESPNHAFILAAYERRELLATLRTLLERNATLKGERDQLLDKLHCMCGSPIDHSAWEGHTPVSVYDYSLDQERSRAEAAEAKLAALSAENERLREALRRLLKAYENAFDWTAELPPKIAEAERIANVVLEAPTAGRVVPSGWQPIETAPKDGTKFLGYGSYLYPGDDHVTEYIEVIEYSGDPEWPWEGQGGKGRPEVFSHWQPLPAAPTAGGGDAE